MTVPGSIHKAATIIPPKKNLRILRHHDDDHCQPSHNVREIRLKDPQLLFVWVLFGWSLLIYDSSHSIFICLSFPCRVLRSLNFFFVCGSVFFFGLLFDIVLLNIKLYDSRCVCLNMTFVVDASWEEEKKKLSKINDYNKMNGI